MRETRGWVVAAALAAAVLVSCSWLDPAASAAARGALEQMLRDGVISQAQFDALVAALDGGGGWRSKLETAAEIALAVGGSLFGVRLWRGPITARRGLAEAIEKVLPPPSVRATTVAADAVAAGKAVP